MDMKILIIVGGVVLIAAVVLHGLWVARRSRTNPLRMELAESGESMEFDEMELLRGELPNGGARMASSRRPAPRSTIMESQKGEILDQRELASEDDTMFVYRASDDAEELIAERDDAAVSKETPIVAGATPARLRKSRKEVGQVSKNARKALEEYAAVEQEDRADLIVVSVMNSDGESWNGSKVLEVLLRHGLKYGDMNIFHRVDSAGVPQFSVANAVEPGSFDLADIKEMATPGITMFLRIPGLHDPLGAYTDMLGTARDTAETLGGELRDEHMNLITSQVVDHYRQQIIEFARKTMSVRA